MSSDLKQKAITGVFWSAIERFGITGIQFLMGIIGFTTALIQKKNTTSNDFSTVFWYNLLMAVVFYFILFFSAGLIADFYNEIKLISLTKIISLSFVINALGAIQRTILVKKLDFKTQSKITIFSVLIGGLTGIYFAYVGYGVWALVIQNLTRTVLENIGLWFFGSQWRPLFLFSKKSFKTLFSFGSKLLISGLLDTIFRNLYTLVIGKLFSAESLGFYSQAERIKKLPATTFYGIMQKVSFPVLSKLQDDDIKLKQSYRKFIKITTFMMFPIMTILGVLAEPLILILLTEEWLPVVPLLQIMCIAGAIYHLHSINLNILNVKGRSDLFLKLEILKKILIAVAIFIFYRWGVIGLVYGQSFISIIALYLNTYYTKQIIGYSFLNQLKDIFPFFFMSVFIGICMKIFIIFVDNIFIQLFVGSFLGVTLYATITILSNISEKAEVLKIFIFVKTKLLKNAKK